VIEEYELKYDLFFDRPEKWNHNTSKTQYLLPNPNKSRAVIINYHWRLESLAK